MLASVRGQDFADWELCLCAGGSPSPQVREALDRAARGDSRVRVRYRDEGGETAAAAEALAMAMARGRVNTTARKDTMRLVAKASISSALTFATPDAALLRLAPSA